MHLAKNSAAREGRRIARLFNQYRDVGDDVRRCDLRRILEEDEIEVVVSDVADPGYTACLLQPVPGQPAGIILAPGQNHGRSRFSVAHELGHYHIPSHEGRNLGWCGEEDMLAQQRSVARLEWEANDFAAELLMPRTPFVRDASEREPTFRRICELASQDMYDVSRTATALRYVKVTKKRCSLVCAENGFIEWVAKSEDFPYRIPWVEDSVPAGSMNSFTSNGEGDVPTGERVEPHIWLEVEQQKTVKVFESTLSIPSQSQVLSLVWVVQEDSWT